MKNNALILAIISLSLSVHAQTLYTPGGTVGNNTTNSNVGVGTSTPNSKLEVVGPATGSGATIRAGGGGDVVMNPGGTLFFDGNYSYTAGNYIRPFATNTQS